MKAFIISVFFLLAGNACLSQILKKIGKDIKNEAEWKIRSKARQKANQAMDSLVTRTQQKLKKKKNNQKESSSKKGSKQNNAGQGGTNNEEELAISEGFIRLAVSASTVFKGGTVVITGSSVKYKNFDHVELAISGKGETETETLKLYENGSFAAGWQAEQSGKFTITVSSSDGKDRQSATVTVTDMELMDDWTNENIEATEKARDKLAKAVDDVKSSIGSRDREQLESRFKKVNQNIDAALKLFREMNKAAGEFGKKAKEAGGMPPNIAGNLSQLNDLLETHEVEMERINNLADHKPYDNTICEYLVMLNEACAAFSTFTNIWTKTVSGLLKNIVIDKGVPKTVEMVNEKTVKTGDTYNFLGKEGAKIFATAKFDAESLTSKLGNAGLAGDIIQFVSDVLLKTYCGIFKGELTHHYTIIYRNKQQVIWWQYSYDTKAAITFRYPKSSSGSIIKMKGNIEGNATSFRFTQDVEQQDDFKESMKGRTKLIPVPLHAPPALPFATSQADELGFGAIARGLVTPAYFNIPVDAEYNTDANTVQLYLNNPIIDFTPVIKFTYAFIGIAAGFPLITRVDFPINKARLTLNAVVSQNNELTVTRGANNNLTVKGKGDRHIGSATEPIEHKISYNLSAMKE